MSADKPTDAQKAALKWLINRTGDGVFDKTLCLVAAGERAGVNRSTWSRLHDLGLVEIYVPAGARHKRVRVTPAGRAIDLSRIRESDCTELGE